MTLLLLAYLGGVLTIVSPCILPVLPFVFARAGRPFVRDGLPMLAGMAGDFRRRRHVGGGWRRLGGAGQSVRPGRGAIADGAVWDRSVVSDVYLIG